MSASEEVLFRFLVDGTEQNRDELVELLRELALHEGQSLGVIEAGPVTRKELRELTDPRAPSHVVLAGDLVEGHDAYLAYGQEDADAVVATFDSAIVIPFTEREES